MLILAPSFSFTCEQNKVCTSVVSRRPTEITRAFLLRASTANISSTTTLHATSLARCRGVSRRSFRRDRRLPLRWTVAHLNGLAQAAASPGSKSKRTSPTLLLKSKSRMSASEPCVQRLKTEWCLRPRDEHRILRCVHAQASSPDTPGISSSSKWAASLSSASMSTTRC